MRNNTARSANDDSRVPFSLFHYLLEKRAADLQPVIAVIYFESVPGEGGVEGRYGRRD